MKRVFKKFFKDKRGSIKEFLSDNLLLFIIVVIIGVVVLPIWLNNNTLLKNMRNYQLEVEEKIEID